MQCKFISIFYQIQNIIFRTSSIRTVDVDANNSLCWLQNMCALLSNGCCTLHVADKLTD